MKRIQFEPFEHLFQHIKQGDVRLYESLKKIVSLLGIYADEINDAEEVIEGIAPFKRTLLLKDTTVGNDIADHVTVYQEGTTRRITGVLRVVITADLVVRVNVKGVELDTITIPSTTAIDKVIVLKVEREVKDGEVFTWDVVASDGQKVTAGVASITVEWE